MLHVFRDAVAAGWGCGLAFGTTASFFSTRWRGTISLQMGLQTAFWGLRPWLWWRVPFKGARKKGATELGSMWLRPMRFSFVSSEGGEGGVAALLAGRGGERGEEG